MVWTSNFNGNRPSVNKESLVGLRTFVRYCYCFYAITAQGKWIETHSRGRKGLRNPQKAGVLVRGNAKVEYQNELVHKLNFTAWCMGSGTSMVRGMNRYKFSLGGSEQEVTV